jgi:hypothetical protein
MNYFLLYIYAVFTAKIIFIILATTHAYLKVTRQTTSDLDMEVVFWKERVEFIFVFLMACLLIYLFFPSTSKTVEISGATRELLYLFGIVILVTAKWGEFFKESPAFTRLQSIIGINY